MLLMRVKSRVPDMPCRDWTDARAGKPRRPVDSKTVLGGLSWNILNISNVEANNPLYFYENENLCHSTADSGCNQL